MKETLTDLSAEYVKSILDYNPDTGIFVWKIKRRGTKKDKQAGACGQHDVSIRINYRIYKAHRLAWLYMTGSWPTHLVDHKDGDPLNNRWSNLRLATYAENARNRKADFDNLAGFKGVKRDKAKWTAAIYVDGKQKHLGTFSTAEAAHEAYVLAAKRHYGEFARW